MFLIIFFYIVETPCVPGDRRSACQKDAIQSLKTAFKPNAQEMAVLSSIAYTMQDEGLQAAQERLKSFFLDDEFTIDTSLSNARHMVFTYGANNPIVAFRGSNDIIDGLTDLALGFSQINNTGRLQEAREDMRQVIAKYGPGTQQNPLVVTGHSLGGYLALQMAKEFNALAFVFNPYIDNPMLENDYNWSLQPTIVRNVDDSVSIKAQELGQKVQIVTIQPQVNLSSLSLFDQQLLTHSLSPFLPQARQVDEVLDEEGVEVQEEDRQESNLTAAASFLSKFGENISGSRNFGRIMGGYFNPILKGAQIVGPAAGSEGDTDRSASIRTRLENRVEKLKTYQSSIVPSERSSEAISLISSEIQILLNEIESRLISEQPITDQELRQLEKTVIMDFTDGDFAAAVAYENHLIDFENNEVEMEPLYENDIISLVADSGIPNGFRLTKNGGVFVNTIFTRTGDIYMYEDGQRMTLDILGDN